MAVFSQSAQAQVQSDLMTIWGGAPLSYQIDKYLAGAGASTNQRNLVQASAAAPGSQGVVLAGDVIRILGSNA